MIVEKIIGPSAVSELADHSAGIHSLDYQNWVKVDHIKVSFNIQHDGSNIYLIYYVEEDHVKAVNTEPNSSVWEESCVEFFFSLKGDEENYYNFEFNAIGTVLGAYGKNRNNRKFLPDSLLGQIETIPSLGREPVEFSKRSAAWNLQVKIPVSTFCFNVLNDLTGIDGHANFYKCGDNLNEPHFISWKPVLTPTPNFHQPRYFGQLSFL